LSKSAVLVTPALNVAVVRSKMRRATRESDFGNLLRVVVNSASRISTLFFFFFFFVFFGRFQGLLVNHSRPIEFLVPGQFDPSLFELDLEHFSMQLIGRRDLDRSATSVFPPLSITTLPSRAVMTVGSACLGCCWPGDSVGLSRWAAFCRGRVLRFIGGAQGRDGNDDRQQQQAENCGASECQSRPIPLAIENADNPGLKPGRPRHGHGCGF